MLAVWKICAVEVCDNPVLQILREEMEGNISGGLYHETQVRLTYNANRNIVPFS